MDRNPMQIQLDDLSEYCRQAKMSINKQKTKCMLFNRGKKNDFIPELTLSNEAQLEVVEEMKLVGYQMRSDLSTKSNTKYIVGRAWKRMWIIRRLIALGASVPDLLKVLRCQVLSVLQFAVPAWTTMISQAESRIIESVQKTGLYLIYGAKYRSYSWALKESAMKSQVEQRNSIFKNLLSLVLGARSSASGFVKLKILI